VPGANRPRIPARQVEHNFIGTAPTYQTFSGGFTKGDPELDPWHSIDQGFVYILYSLDEMRLTEDKIDLLGFLNYYADQVH
jgi:hypothetical protein